MKNLYNKLSLFSVLALVAFEQQPVWATSNNPSAEEIQDSQKPIKSQTSESFDPIQDALQRIKVDQFLPCTVLTSLKKNSLEDMKRLIPRITPDDDMFDTWISLILKTFPTNSDFEEALMIAQTRNQSEMSPAAFNNLGVMYHYGYSIEQDFMKAFECYEKAANQGLSNAQYNLGCMYWHGHGVVQDYTKAVEYWQKAADQGHIKAIQGLGNAYQSGRGIDRNFTEAKKCYEKAIERGSASSYVNLGDLYKLGRGVDQDYIKAIECYKEAANQGVEEAQLKLGLIYQEGKMIEKDLAQSSKWLLMYSENKPVSNKNNIEITFAPSTITTEEETSFKNKQKKLKGKIKASLGLHGMEKGVNQPNAFFQESKFAIPALVESYQEIIDFEDVLLKSILALNQSGFMIKCLKVKDKDVETFKSSLSTDIKYYELQGQSFLTFGQKNIEVADNFMKVFDKTNSYSTAISNILRILTEIHESFRTEIKLSDEAQVLKNQYESRLELNVEKQTWDMTEISSDHNHLRKKVEKEIKMLEQLPIMRQQLQNLLIEGAPVRNKLFLQSNEYIDPNFKN